MISFSTKIKNEVSKKEVSKIEKIAELSAMIRLNYKDDEKIEIITENSSIARRIYKIIKDLYNIAISVTIRKNKKTIYILDIKNKKNYILKNLSIINENNEYLINPEKYIIDDMESKKSYLRGVFLISGSINDPKQSRYHLEFLIKKENDGVYLMNLINEFNLNSKIIKRENGFMVYIKEAEKIADFLRIIDAGTALLYFEDIRIYRDYKNMNNRLNNCEQANVDKTMEAARKQVENIKKIIKHDAFDLLDSKTKEAAEYRLKYFESSLEELSEIITSETGNKIGKSGLNHRFRKIKSIAEKIKNQT